MVLEIDYIPTPNYATPSHNVVVQPVIQYLISQISQAIVIRISQAVGSVFFSQAIVIWYLLSLSYLSNISSHNHSLSFKPQPFGIFQVAGPIFFLSIYSYSVSLKPLVWFLFFQAVIWFHYIPNSSFHQFEFEGTYQISLSIIEKSWSE